MRSLGFDWITSISSSLCLLPVPPLLLFVLLILMPTPLSSLTRESWVDSGLEDVSVDGGVAGHSAKSSLRTWSRLDDDPRRYETCCENHHSTNTDADPHHGGFGNSFRNHKKHFTKTESRKVHRRRSRIPKKSKNSWKAEAAERKSSTNLRQQLTAPPEPSPKFVYVQPVVVVKRNSLATLPCSVKHLGDREVVWRQIGTDQFLTIGTVVWSKDPRISVDYHLREDGITAWDLLIKSVSSVDAGMYECQVTSSEQIVMKIELKMEELPTTTSQPKTRSLKKEDHHQMSWANTDIELADQQNQPLREESITAGLPIKLTCNISLDKPAVPAVSFSWFKDGNKLKSNHRVLLTSYRLQERQVHVHELRIDRSTLGDTGEYTCRVRDKVLHNLMVYVLPNTTIGAEPIDRPSNTKSFVVSSLSTESRATALLDFQGARMHRFILSLLPLLSYCITSCILSSNVIPFLPLNLSVK